MKDEEENYHGLYCYRFDCHDCNAGSCSGYTAKSEGQPFAEIWKARGDLQAQSTD
jgi:hypothetical protein